MIAAPTPRRTHRAASSLLAWFAAAAFACSSSTPAGGAGNPDDGGGGGGGGAIGGRSATAFNCESFPAAELLTAIKTLAPKTTPGTVKTERLADKFDGALVCHYTFAANLAAGLDPSTVKGQNVTFTAIIRDKVVDGLPPLQTIRDAFFKERDLIKSQVKGDATSTIQYVFLEVTDLGDGAFFDDKFTRSSDGPTESVSSRLSVLRSTLPVSAEIDLGYGVTNDTSITAPPVASDPFQNDTRHDLVKAVARVVLSKL